MRVKHFGLQAAFFLSVLLYVFLRTQPTPTDALMGTFHAFGRSLFLFTSAALLYVEKLPFGPPALRKGLALFLFACAVLLVVVEVKPYWA